MGRGWWCRKLFKCCRRRCDGGKTSLCLHELANFHYFTDLSLFWRQPFVAMIYFRRARFPVWQKSRMHESRCFGPCGLMTTVLYSQNMAWEWCVVSTGLYYIWLVNLNVYCSYCILFQNWWQAWKTWINHWVFKYQRGIIHCCTTFRIHAWPLVPSHSWDDFSSTNKAVCPAALTDVSLLAFHISEGPHSQQHSWAYTRR